MKVYGDHVGHKWLSGNSGGLVKPAKFGAPRKGYKPLCDAPGTYVLEK